MRKALVNDIVRSFTYAVRTSNLREPGAFCFVILGKPSEMSWGQIHAQALAPFTSWAYAMLANYVVANRLIVLLASYLRMLSEAEQLYAAQLMQRYYLPGVSLNVSL